MADRPPHRPFVLLDRDGTVNVDTHYLSDPADLLLERNAGAGLRRLKALGFGLATLTNQSGIARGYFDRARLDEIHARLDEMLKAEGVTVEGYFVCPHGPDEDCACRKPLPGLAEQARAALGFDPAQAWMIGDKAADIGLGKAVGARTILVRTGKGAKTEAKGSEDPSWQAPDFIADDLLAAADFIEKALAAPV